VDDHPGAQTDRRANRTRFLPFCQQNQVARGSGEIGVPFAPRRRRYFLEWLLLAM
jgi:hypothetical protein